MYTQIYVNTHTDTQRKVCLGDASSRGNEVAKEDTGSTLGQEDQTPPASGPQERGGLGPVLYHAYPGQLQPEPCYTVSWAQCAFSGEEARSPSLPPASPPEALWE